MQTRHGMQSFDGPLAGGSAGQIFPTTPVTQLLGGAFRPRFGAGGNGRVVWRGSVTDAPVAAAAKAWQRGRPSPGASR
ncbi:MAG TPA: hypothetical protein VMF52_03765 [Steroidobacteraceae bacterium]|nr:hypothetical protein [Steroidobacteraceae bacterium]